MTRDLRTSRTLRRIVGMAAWNLPEQLALAAAGSSSRSGHNRGTAVEADAIGEQQTKRTPSGSRVEAVTIGEQQPKRTKSGSSWQAASSS